MSAVNPPFTGFTASTGGNRDRSGFSQERATGEHAFSKWMHHPSGQLQLDNRQQPLQQHEAAAKHEPNRPSAYQDNHASKATDDQQPANRQASATDSCHGTSDGDSVDQDEDTAQDLGWLPPVLTELPLPMLAPTNDALLPATGGQWAPNALPASGNRSTVPASPFTLRGLAQAISTPLNGALATAEVPGTASIPADAQATPRLSEGQTGTIAWSASGALALTPPLTVSRQEPLPADIAAMVATLQANTQPVDALPDSGSDTNIGDLRAAISLTQPTPLAAARDVAVVTPPSVVPHLQHDTFSDDIGAHLKWMADQKVGHAQLRISPNDMGTVEIRLKLEGDRVSADFNTSQADVRHALEQSLPRLRELLGQQGFQLAHADVGQQSRQNNGTHSPVRSAGNTSDMPQDGRLATQSVTNLRQHSLLDTYA